MIIRKYEEKDAEEISNLICRNFREVNVKDYSEEEMEVLAQEYNGEKV